MILGPKSNALSDGTTFIAQSHRYISFDRLPLLFHPFFSLFLVLLSDTWITNCCSLLQSNSSFILFSVVCSWLLCRSYSWRSLEGGRSLCCCSRCLFPLFPSYRIVLSLSVLSTMAVLTTHAFLNTSAL